MIFKIPATIIMQYVKITAISFENKVTGMASTTMIYCLIKRNMKIWLGVHENKDEIFLLVQVYRPQGIPFNDERSTLGMVCWVAQLSSSIPTPMSWLLLSVTTWLLPLQLHLLTPPPETRIKEHFGLVSLLKKTKTSQKSLQQMSPGILLAHA